MPSVFTHCFALLTNRHTEYAAGPLFCILRGWETRLISRRRLRWPKVWLGKPARSSRRRGLRRDTRPRSRFATTRRPHFSVLLAVVRPPPALSLSEEEGGGLVFSRSFCSSPSCSPPLPFPPFFVDYLPPLRRLSLTRTFGSRNLARRRKQKQTTNHAKRTQPIW
jgi:hypothetical protein